MMTIGQLAQQFLTIDPQKSPARLAFYHYIKNFLPLDAQFKQEHIDSFYDRALSSHHWQTQKNQLGEIIQDDLTAISVRHPFGFDLEQVVHAHEMQIVNLDYPRDFAALLSAEVTKIEKNGEKVKSFRLNNEKTAGREDVLLLRLQRDGSVNVEVRQNIAVLVDGTLQLLRPHSRLCYTPELDFAANVDQVLSTSLLRVAVFSASAKQSGRVKGRLIQGASFHCSETFDRPLQEVTELVQAIKKVERLYINPVTDPYYQHMIENFEQAFNEKEI